MDDRISDLWGERTPYGAGEEWPVRVDENAPGEVERWVQEASLLHSNGDAVDVAVADGRVVGVRGRAHDRVNRGRLDPKDFYGWQANNAPDRLKRPLVREGGSLIEASWGEAMGRDRDASHGRQHTAVHGDRRRRAEGVVRHRRPARQLRRRRPL